MTKSNSPKILRSANRYIILKSLLDNEKLTIEEMVHLTSLSRPTVLNVISGLMEEDLVTKAGMVKSDIGRQPMLYSINTNSLFAFGIDVALPSIHIAISDLAGNMVYCDTFEMPLESQANDIVNELVTNIIAALSSSKIEKRKIIGLGLGMPAAVNILENQAVRIDKVPSWHDIDIASYINEKTGFTVYVHNDVHLLALAEQKRLGLQNENFLYLMHRSGIGSAIFINGELYDGVFGNSGYLGHTSINVDGDFCECGNRGCLELYCSQRAIIRDFNRSATNSGYPLCYSLKTLFELSEEGNPLALQVVQRAGFCLGLGISNMIKICDIHYVVIGGLLCKKSNPFFRSIVDSVNKNTAHFSIRPAKIELGLLEDESSGLSGCYYVLNHFFSAPKLNTLI